MTSENPNTPRQHNDKPVDQQSAAGKGNQKVGGGRPSPSEVVPPPHNPDNSNNGGHNSPPGWFRLLEAIGIVSVIIYTVVTWCLWRDSHNNFIADERAWVAAVDTLNPPEFPNIEIGNNAPTAKWLINYEKSPGIHVTHRMEERIFCNGFPDDPPYSAPPVGKKTYGPSSGHLWPNQRIQIQYATLDHQITEQGMNSLRAGACFLTLYGTVNYCDVFGRAHYQHFCGIWYPGTPHNFIECVSYTDGDEEHHEEKSCPVTKPE